MTARQFDAPASSPRLASSTQDRSHPVARIAWLIARFVRHEPVGYRYYYERFGRSMNSFHSDITTLRSARIYRNAERLGDDIT
jgi:hypothetical protein